MQQEFHSSGNANYLTAMRDYYNSGATKTYAFRKEQLRKLKGVVLKYEGDIHHALWLDLKKSAAESYAGETGLLLAEIRVAISNLQKWMRPKSVPGNLVNYPSTSKIYHDPLGVILIIAPWNYPFQLSLIPLVGAIAAGNCSVLKPSEFAPATADILQKIIAEIYPAEYVSIVLGDGAAVIPEMIRSFRFDHIFYTGSKNVGKIIYQMAAADLVPVTLELGGKSPAIIEDDANIRVTARRIALAKFANIGQTCVAPDYLLVHEGIQTKFIEELKRCLVEFFGTDPLISRSYGKIINEKRFDQLVSYLDQGEIIFGGQHNRSALCISPTLMIHVSTESPLMTDEIFGPILPIFPFKQRDEALSILQLNPDPLSFYVFTSDSNKEKSWVEGIRFGGGCVNNAAWQFTSHHLPFGGVGFSGIGAYHGKYSFKTFTHAKPILKSATWIDLNLKYPPFDGKLKWFKRFIW